MGEAIRDLQARLAELEQRKAGPYIGVRYVGVYRDGAFECGDVVTFRGGMWVALNATSTKPPSSDWQACG